MTAAALDARGNISRGARRAAFVRCAIMHVLRAV